MSHDVRALYSGCYRRLVAQAFALTADLGLAQDAVEEAFARALASPRSFGRVDDPEAWLRARALGLARRRVRRHALVGRLRRHPDTGVVEASPTPVDTADEELLWALATLPERVREIVALRHLAGLTVHEIANLIGVADATVYERLDQGDRMLSTRLGTASDV